jgi:hypothetical protein
MPKTRLWPLVISAMLIIMLWPASPVKAADISACYQSEVSPSDDIRCNLWKLAAYMNENGDARVQRRTNRIPLGPRRWFEAFASYKGLESSWPVEITIRFYEGNDDPPRLVEEIRDIGLNGLSPNEPEDAYLRHQGKEQPVNLLADLDPNLVEPINQDYRARLSEALDALAKQNEYPAPVVWEAVSQGLEIGRLKATSFIRLGSNEIVIIRFDPKMFDVVPYAAAEKENESSRSLISWAEQIPQAVAVFNSGQYYPDGRFIGLLRKDGQKLGSGLHHNWQAVLLSGGPDESTFPKTTIFDLQFDDFNPDETPYRYAVQSFMLLDRLGFPRVRQSDRLASRTVVAQDKQQRMMIIMAPGACTLYELALLLKNSNMEIAQAMSLDGGFESQALLRLNPDNLVVYGAWVVNERRQYYQESLRLPLPSVLTLIPRQP